MFSIFRLAYASKKVIETMDEIDSLESYSSFNELRNRLEKLDTIEEVRNVLLDMYKQAIDQMNNSTLNVRMNFVAKLKEIIQEDYANPELTVKELASRMNFSINHVRKIFKEVTGGSVSDYINEYRYIKAKELLLETDLTVTKISESIGITNTNYFFTLFKKYSGLTPSQFRRRNEI